MESDIFQRLNDSYLDGMRSVADDAFDRAVERALRHGRSGVYSLLKAVEDNASLPGAIPQGPLEELALTWTSLPDWADPERIAAGQDLFEEYTSEIMMLLGALSLPYCYAAAKGARVLYLSEKIRKNTHQRLLDTSDFVWDVLDKNAFSPSGRGWAAILKTRIIHAMVRAAVHKDPSWNIPGEIPINQEDMAGTNLAFSYMILLGLKKLGHTIPQSQKEGFLHLWNVISHGLGLHRALLPASMKEAYWLERTIRQRQFRTSPEGRTLTSSLISYYKQSVPDPLFRPLLPAHIAFLLGGAVAAMVGIAPSGLEAGTLNAVMRTMQWTNRLRPHSSTRAEAEQNRMKLGQLA